MCLVIFAYRASAQYPLLVAANRDEFHARPTLAAALWEEHPNLLAGRDLEQGGTWMGITRDGRFAAITNVRGGVATVPAPRSRGELPLHFLTGSDGPGDYLAALAATSDQYAGFNLLVGDNESLWYYGNFAGEPPRALTPGLYGLSNAALDTPWPKVDRGKQRLGHLLTSGEVEHDHLATLVSDPAAAGAEELAAIGQHSELEQRLSSQFIIMPQYGTRSTTTLRATADGVIDWREVSFDESGERIGSSELVLTT